MTGTEPTAGDAALDEKRVEDEVYLKTYFNRMETGVRPYSRNPTVYVQAMTNHLAKVNFVFFFSFFWLFRGLFNNCCWIWSLSKMIPEMIFE